MQFEHSQKTKDLIAQLEAFFDKYVYPTEEEYHAWDEDPANLWKRWPGIDQIKEKAKAEGLWNLFLPHEYGDYSPGLTNMEYAPLAEIMGRVPHSSEFFNCSAPDTGNMEVLAKYGSPAQKEKWLKPLLAGEIRSAYVMTEPQVASSDATNLELTILPDGNDYVINGRKWWISGVGDPHCRLVIFLGVSDPDAEKHRRHSMILVPLDAPGIEIIRPLTVFGYDDAPHGHMEMVFDNVRVPAENMLLGEGRGFEIAQGRLGPGRIHHCMRLIGLAERCLELMCRRVKSRVAFGRPIGEQSVTLERIAESRILIDQARLLTMKVAWMMDTVGNKAARAEIAMIKVAAPTMACKVIDWAIQAHGAGGLSEDFILANYYAHARKLRFADGPDEVHRNQIGRLELAKYDAA